MTKQRKDELPSNKSFGAFISFLFYIATLYFYFYGELYITIILLISAVIFSFLALIGSKFLAPLNTGWMWLGRILGKIISPIILFFIFFLIFTPVSLIMKIYGRDELKIKKLNKLTYWVTYDRQGVQDGFKNQF